MGYRTWPPRLEGGTGGRRGQDRDGLAARRNLRGAGNAARRARGGPEAEAPAFAGTVDSLRQTAAVLVLIAIEDRHRVYREAVGDVSAGRAAPLGGAAC